MVKLINRHLVVKEEINENKHMIVLKRINPSDKTREIKLADVMELLPAGLIYKEETGLGATYRELTTHRNSIIVEPIKVTASSKAHKHNALYVGSPTKKHPKKIDNEDIKDYIADDKMQFKKIVVVADSLKRLLSVMGKEEATKYFLLIDEIDSFQLDSFYRSSMEECIDFYKSFSEERRAMVSATLMAFSDPDLANEPLTHIRYSKSTVRNIGINYAPVNIQGAVINRLTQILKENKDDKIMIAYNSVSGCYNMAAHLHKHFGIPDEDIRILCGVGSKDKVGEYFSELESSELPAKINFVTSAYFTGFDLDERYHLISVSSNISIIHSLSDKRLKQIAGRCRVKEGLLSETIIYDIVRDDKAKIENFKLDDLIDAAQKEILAINCIEVNYKQHPLLKNITKTVRDLVAQHTSVNGYQIVRIKQNEPQISYLNLDAYLESIRVRNELYLKADALPDALRKAGHKIFHINLSHAIIIEKNEKEKESRQAQIKSVLEKLSTYPKHISPLSDLDTDKSDYTPLQVSIIKKWRQIYRYIDRDTLFPLIEKASESRDTRIINNLFFAAYFLTLDPSSLYKRIVLYQIPIGQSFTAEELLSKWNTILLESGFMNNNIKTSTQAVRLTKLHYRTTKKKGNAKLHYISEENPFKLKLYKYRHYKDNERDNYVGAILFGKDATTLS